MRIRPRPNGSSIEQLRVAHHLTTAELARRVGISRQYMSRIQEGSRGASPSVIKKIADAFSVEVKVITEDHS